MPPGDGKSRRSEGKGGKGVLKRPGRKAGDGKKGAAKAARADICPRESLKPLVKLADKVSTDLNEVLRPVRALMYGHGDGEPELINSSTVDLVEDIIIDYCTTVMDKAADVAALRSAKLQAEDILYMFRKDARKYQRCKQLLSMNEEIKQARKQFEDDEAIQRR